MDWAQSPRRSPRSGTGAFSISNTLPIVYPEEGTFPVNITVMDDGGSTILMSNVAYVADAPLIPVPLPALTGTEGTPLAVFPLTSVPIASFIDTNPLATVADFNGDDVDIDWGDSTHSDGTVTLVGGVFIVAGNHTYDEVTAPGTPPAQQPPYTITVTVHDDGGSVTTITNTAKIVDAPLSLPTAINVTGTEGLPLVNVPLATFADRNHFASVSDYNATIDWGDGTLLDRNTVVTIVGDAFLGGFPNTLVQVSGNHTYAEEGTYKVVVTILDIDNPANTLNATSVATINDAPLQNSVGTPSIPGQAGVALSVTNKGVPDISDFTDANPNATIADFPAAGVLIFWGDGTNSQGSVRSIGNAPGKTFIVSGNHTYANPGDYQIETFVTDVGGSRTVAFSEAIVTRAPLALPFFNLPFPLKAVEGLVFPGIVPLVIFVGSPGSVVGDFNAQIQFGDGSSAQGKIEDAGSETSGEDYYVFAPAHTYDEEGTKTITVTITLTSTGQSVSEDQSIDVTDADITVIGATADLPEGVDEDQVMGTFTDANPNATLADFTATVEPGSPVMSVADVMITQPDGVGTPFVVTAEVNGDDSGLGNEEQDGSGFLLTVAGHRRERRRRAGPVQLVRPSAG